MIHLPDKPKRDKADVQYSKGRRDSHCEICRYFIPHYEGYGGCQKVKGRIEPSYWCKLFKRKG